MIIADFLFKNRLNKIFIAFVFNALNRSLNPPGPLNCVVHEIAHLSVGPDVNPSEPVEPNGINVLSSIDVPTR